MCPLCSERGFHCNGRLIQIVSKSRSQLKRNICAVACLCRCVYIHLYFSFPIWMKQKWGKNATQLCDCRITEIEALSLCNVEIISLAVCYIYENDLYNNWYTGGSYECISFTYLTATSFRFLDTKSIFSFRSAGLFVYFAANCTVTSGHSADVVWEKWAVLYGANCIIICFIAYRMRLGLINCSDEHIFFQIDFVCSNNCRAANKYGVNVIIRFATPRARAHKR